MKALPIGIHTFARLIEGNLLYVDKTEDICNLFGSGGQYYFLSRPRRFGKTLLISTLKEIFSGNRELFQGLWIYDRIAWEQHPIIHLDFLGKKYGNPEELSETLEFLINQNARTYGIRLEESGYDKRFNELIRRLAHKNKVVVLVDEYDKPIINHIENPDIARENRNILRTFYEAIKEADEYLEFALITGVSKFSKVSIFSGLNNLDDITLDERFANICGYSETEFFHYFQEEIASLSNRWGVAEAQLREKIRNWYNGYSWDGKNFLYNPVSVHYFFSKQTFGNYWFSTATPTFLVEKIKEKELSISDFENIEADDSEFDSYDVDNIVVVSLLFQTGYLTVKKIEEKVGERTYYLSYPNREVRESFLKHLLRSYTQNEFYENVGVLKKLRRSLDQDDIPGFFDMMKSLFASLPYDMMVRDREGYYQTVIYLILRLIGIDTQTEVETNVGRLDAVVETDSHIYVMEYKMGRPETALAQIKEKKYYQRYLNREKSVKLIGIGIDPGERNITDFISEDVDIGR